MERALVLARGAAGLRAGSWLAAQGASVRWIGLEGLPSAPPSLLAVSGEAHGLTQLLGPVVDTRPRLGLWFDGRVVDVPRRRRDLHGLCGEPSLGGVLRWAVARARGGRDDTLAGWCRAELGPVPTERIALPLASTRLGGDAEQLAARQALRLFGGGMAGGWWAPTGDTGDWADGRREAILDGGGEVLENVAIESLEVEDGRVVAVHTEFGRELVDGVVHTDLPPAEVLELLPADAIPAGLRQQVAELPAAHRIEVTVSVEPVALPWVLNIVRGPMGVSRITRVPDAPGMPRPDSLIVEIVAQSDDPAWTDDDVAAGRAVDALRRLAVVRSMSPVVHREARSVPRCTAAAEATTGRLLEVWDRLGIVPVGETALHSSLTIYDESVWLSLAPGGLRAARRALAPTGRRRTPWTFVA